jgi:hypothetical protein
MKILVQRLQSGQWIAWFEGTTDRAAADTMAEAVTALVLKRSDTRLVRVFGEGA